MQPDDFPGTLSGFLGMRKGYPWKCTFPFLENLDWDQVSRFFWRFASCFTAFTGFPVSSSLISPYLWIGICQGAFVGNLCCVVGDFFLIPICGCFFLVFHGLLRVPPGNVTSEFVAHHSVITEKVRAGKWRIVQSTYLFHWFIFLYFFWHIIYMYMHHTDKIW